MVPLSLGFWWVGVELFPGWVCSSAGWIQIQDSWNPGPERVQQCWRSVAGAGRLCLTEVWLQPLHLPGQGIQTAIWAQGRRAGLGRVSRGSLQCPGPGPGLGVELSATSLGLVLCGQQASEWNALDFWVPPSCCNQFSCDFSYLVAHSWSTLCSTLESVVVLLVLAEWPFTPSIPRWQLDSGYWTFGVTCRVI